MQVENLLREWRATPDRALTIALCDAIADRGDVPAGTTDYEVALHVGGYAGVRYADDADVLVSVGRMYLAAAELRRALTPLAQAAKISSSPVAFRLLGVLLLRMGQARRAVQAFERAIEGGIEDAETFAWHASAEAYKQVQEELGPEAVAERVARAIPAGAAGAPPPPGAVRPPGSPRGAVRPPDPPRAAMSSVTEVMPSRLSGGDFVRPPFPIADEDTATDTHEPRLSPLPGEAGSELADGVDTTLQAQPAPSFAQDDSDPSSMGDEATAVISVKRLMDSRYVQADAPGPRGDARPGGRGAERAGRAPLASEVDFDLDREGLNLDELETNVLGVADPSTDSELVTGQVPVQPAAAPSVPPPEAVAARVPAKVVPVAAADRPDPTNGTGAPIAKPVSAASRPPKRSGAPMAVVTVLVLLIVGVGVGVRAGKLPWLAQHLPAWLSQGADESARVEPEVTTAAQGPSTAAALPAGVTASSGAPSADMAPAASTGAPTTPGGDAASPTSVPATSTGAPPATGAPVTSPATGTPARPTAPDAPATAGTPATTRRTPPRASATPTSAPKEAPDPPIWLGDPELRNQ